MRTSPLVLLALAACACGGAGAQTSTTLPGVNISGTRPIFHYYVPPQVVHEVSGTYLMSNNQSARISDRRSKLYVEFDQRVTELQPIGEDLYASSDNQMVLRYAPEAFDGQVVIRYVPRSALASKDATPRTVTGVGTVSQR